MREKYESLSLGALKEVAKARGLKGISTLKKSELVERMVEEDQKEKSMENKTVETKSAENKTEEAKSSRAPMEQSELDSGITAVSYTHLDVYKRQLLSRRFLIYCILNKL